MGGRYPNCDEKEKMTPQLAGLQKIFEKKDECSRRGFESGFPRPEPLGVFIQVVFLAARSRAVIGGGGGTGQFEIQYAQLRLHPSHILVGLLQLLCICPRHCRQCVLVILA